MEIDNKSVIKALFLSVKNWYIKFFCLTKFSLLTHGLDLGLNLKKGQIFLNFLDVNFHSKTIVDFENRLPFFSQFFLEFLNFQLRGTLFIGWFYPFWPTLSVYCVRMAAISPRVPSMPCKKVYILMCKVWFLFLAPPSVPFSNFVWQANVATVAQT